MGIDSLRRVHPKFHPEKENHHTISDLLDGPDLVLKDPDTSLGVADYNSLGTPAECGKRRGHLPISREVLYPGI
jgi:hypothetical protein